MIIYGRPISARRIAKSIFAAVVILGMAWVLLAISEPMDQTIIEVMK